MTAPATAADIEQLFTSLRHDAAHHLGAGDIRLTAGHQAHVIAAIRDLQARYADGLAAWCANSAHHAAHIARLERQLREQENRT